MSVIAIANGNVYVAHPGDATWTTTSNDTGDTPPLNFDGVVAMAPNGGKMYFADGTNWVRYDPRTNTVERWSPSYGSLPADDQNNKPRLICTWRGRTVLSGLLQSETAWFMSRVDAPTDWEYFPLDPERQGPGQAVAGSNAPQGLVGDTITCLIPYTDDKLIFGGSNSIHMMNGDPTAGGRIDRVTDAIGMAWGKPFCQDPYGTIYFVSNTLRIFSYRPGELPVPISQPIEQLLQAFNSGTTTITAVWDDRFQAARFFFTPTLAPTATTHLLWEARTQAWWKVVHANTDHDPLCCAILDGNRPEDRVAAIGSWDGYVRAYYASATDDDGTAIASYVYIGPLNAKDLDAIRLTNLQAVLGESSGTVDFSVHSGRTPEAAFAAAAGRTGTFPAGRSLLMPVRVADHAHYVKIGSASAAWQAEQIRAFYDLLGKVRQRGR